MSTNYVLHENKLTSDPNDYMARVRPTGTADFDDIVSRIIERGSTVVKSDILSVLEDFNSAVESILLEGRNVNMPLANFKVAIKGTFNGLEDSYDSTRHKIVASASPGSRLKKTISDQMKVSKQESSKTEPTPQVFINHNTNERNSTVTPGGMGEIIGYRLKFDESDTQQGIFFIAEDGTETRAQIVGANQPSKLLFIIPELTAGDYSIEVRSIYNENELRSGSLDETVTVAA